MATFVTATVFACLVPLVFGALVGKIHANSACLEHMLPQEPHNAHNAHLATTQARLLLSALGARLELMLLSVSLSVSPACLAPLVLRGRVSALRARMVTSRDQELQSATPAATDNCSPRTIPAHPPPPQQPVCGETPLSRRCCNSASPPVPRWKIATAPASRLPIQPVSHLHSLQDSQLGSPRASPHSSRRGNRRDNQRNNQQGSPRVNLLNSRQGSPQGNQLRSRQVCPQGNLLVNQQVSQQSNLLGSLQRSPRSNLLNSLQDSPRGSPHASQHNSQRGNRQDSPRASPPGSPQDSLLGSPQGSPR